MTEIIELDVRRLRAYFERLFGLIRELETKQPQLPLSLESMNELASRDYSAFVKPDMVANVYSLVDFWLSRLCEAGEPLARGLRWKDIRGRSDLDARYRFLTTVVGLDLNDLRLHFSHLNVVREVRNIHQHQGGHATDDQQQRLRAQKGLQLFTALVVIEDDFVWESLEHSRALLLGSWRKLSYALPAGPAA